MEDALGDLGDSLQSLGVFAREIPPEEVTSLLSADSSCTEISQQVLKRLLPYFEAAPPLPSPLDLSRDFVGSLLKILDCPNVSLREKWIGLHDSSLGLRLSLLQFLVSELQTALLLDRREIDRSAADEEVAMAQTASSSSGDVIASFSSLVSRACGVVSICARVGRPEGDDAALLVKWIADHLSSMKREDFGQPLPQLSTLSAEQWTLVRRTFTAMKSDFQLRRGLLLQRLDVSRIAFGYSKKAADLKDQIDSVAVSFASRLSDCPSVTPEMLFVFRPWMSPAGMRRAPISSFVKTLMMGEVPDRGGRPLDASSSSSSSSGRSAFGGHGGGRGGHRRGGSWRGGERMARNERVQGGWGKDSDESDHSRRGKGGWGR